MKPTAKIPCLLLALLPVLASCAPGAGAPAGGASAGMPPVTEDDWGRALKSDGGMQLAEEKGGIQLWLDAATSRLQVRDTATGAQYDSFPVLSEPSMQTDGVNATVQFINNTGSETIYNTMSDAIAYNQFTYSKLPDGVRITYVLGEVKKIRLAPVVLSADRMENRILSKLDETDQTIIKTFYTYFSLDDIKSDSDKAILKERYPSLEKHSVYALGPSANDTSQISDLALSTVEQILAKAGYSTEDLKQDNADNGIQTADPNLSNIQLSLEVRIENGDVTVTVPGNGLLYNPSTVHITDLAVLPFLASSDKDGGYLMVPDGSGALIRFNNGKTKYEAYKKPIYGQDYTLPVKEKSTEAASEIHAPVFGVKSPSGSLLGIVEKGDALGYINAAVAGKNAPVNRAYASFQLCRFIPQNRYTVGSSSNAYQKHPYGGDIKIRYRLLGRDGGYVEMASSYRDYLAGSIKPAQKDPPPLAVNFYGGVTEVRTAVLFPVKTTLPLTTFPQAQGILEELAKGGAGRVGVQYTHWANNGAENTAANKVSTLGALGGKSGLNSLLQYVQSGGAGAFLDVEALYVKKANGFSYKKDAARSITDEMAYKQAFNLATLEPDKDDRTYIVSGGAMDKIFAGLQKSYAKLANTNLSLGSVGTDLSSDYRQTATYDREQTKSIVAGALKKLADAGYRLSFSGGNAYVLPYAAQLVDVPVTSSNNYLFDETVPFLPIALSGLLPVYSQPLNMSSRYESELLACIEDGVFPKYDLMYSENSVLKETDYNYYGMYYKDWLKDMEKAYQIFSGDLAKVAGKKIVGHEQMADGVYKTTYENGVAVYVNYNDTQAEAGGLTIQPMSYRVAGQEGKP